MYEVVWQEDNRIELSMWDELTVDEFKEAIHQLESLCTAHPSINVLMDAGGLTKYDPRVMIEEYDFYKKYKHHLSRIAVVSDSKFQNFIIDQLSKFTDTEIKTFSNEETEAARKWIFPGRLPG